MTATRCSPPNEEMRAGPSIYTVALTYDLCYDAWPAEYRQDQAQKIFTWKGRCRKNGHNVSLESMAKQAYSPNPVSNHYALQVGGAGLALLALMDDPELTDEQRKLAREWYESGIIKQARRVFTVDFGATGYCAEHGGPGVIAMSWTMTPWLKAEKVAGVLHSNRQNQERQATLVEAFLDGERGVVVEQARPKGFAREDKLTGEEHAVRELLRHPVVGNGVAVVFTSSGEAQLLNLEGTPKALGECVLLSDVRADWNRQLPFQQLRDHWLRPYDQQPAWTIFVGSPFLQGKRMYVRTYEYLYCIGPE